MARVASDRGESLPSALAYIRQGNADVNSYDHEEALRWSADIGADLFSPEPVAREAFRETVQRLVLGTRPFWARMAYLGRRRCVDLLDADGQQCLEIAGVLDDSAEALAWWDSVAALARRWSEEDRFRAGRAAEEKTMELETWRLRKTGRRPEWISREDNGAGYDVLSWRQVMPTAKSQVHRRAWRHQHIEVKSSSAGGPIYISDNEWAFAIAQQASWELQVWLGRSPAPVTLTFAQVESHIPKNRGDGSWTSVAISTGSLVGRKKASRSALAEVLNAHA